MCEGFVSDRDSSPRACDLRFRVLTWALKHVSSGQIRGMVSEGGTAPKSLCGAAVLTSEFALWTLANAR